MATLLDTNVLSELLRVEPAPSVLRWFAMQPSDALLVSTVTQAEMLVGARLLPAGQRRKRLQTALDAMFTVDFEGRLLPFDSAAAVAYSEVVVARRERGRPISQFDAQIAAIAIRHGLALATRNVGDFDGLALDVVDPWA